MNLGFVILYVDDVAKMKAFYSDTLGIPVMQQFDGPTFVALQPSAGSILALQDKTTAELPAGQAIHPSGVEVSFEVADVDGLCQQWQAKGVQVVTAPIDMPFGRYFKAKDPEGHYVSAYRLPQR